MTRAASRLLPALAFSTLAAAGCRGESRGAGAGTNAPGSGGAETQQPIAGSSGATSSAGATAGTGGRAGAAGGLAQQGQSGSAGAVIDPPLSPPKVSACDALPAPGKWQEITPPGVATSDALALDPFTVGTLWLGADPIGGGTPGLGGLFKSTDCGSTWSHVNTGANGTAVDGSHMWSLVIDPVDQGTVYAVGAYGPQGLWKSTNDGVDWVQLFPESSEFYKVVQYNFASNVSMDPHNHLHLVVGTHANCAAPYDPVCQAETTDGGATWKIVRIPNPTGYWVEQTGPYVVDGTSWLYATEFSGMFLTTDHGATWTNATPAGVSGAAGGEFTARPLLRSAKGFYYLPSFSPGGLLSSPDGRTWSAVPGAPTGISLCVTSGGGNVYLADFVTGIYNVAPESDTSRWTTMPSPFTVGNGKQGPVYLEYDEKHHLLYSSNFTGGVWRIVTP